MCSLSMLRIPLLVKVVSSLTIMFEKTSDFELVYLKVIDKIAQYLEVKCPRSVCNDVDAIVLLGHHPM